MTIASGLFIYPIKSCAGIALQSATLGRAGFEAGGIGDREWMLVDATTGIFVTQRQAPRMALIRPRLEGDALAVEAQGMPPLTLPADELAPRSATLSVKVWNHECMAFDAGDAAAQWFSAFLNRPVRLARFDPSHRRLSNREWTSNVEALNRFSDGYPILAVAEATLAELNDRLIEAGRNAIPMNRFRPNLVLADVGPGDEDRMVSLRCGATVLTPVKPCPRCPIPSIDQDTAVRGDDPLDILAHYRDHKDLGLIFGQNVIVTAGIGTTLAVGDRFDVEWNF
ncbi:MAG: MOSC domain-containing protein [Burkholderiales bacterium]